MLEVGKKAPVFLLKDQAGKKHSLKDYMGKWVVVYFYPKDDTSGCTKEACAIAEIYQEFKKFKVAVFGVSKDSVTSHAKFAKKYNLPFTLLSDESTKMIEKYGAWVEKSMYGRTYMGIQRITYLVDPVGKVAKVYLKVKPTEHAIELLSDIKALQKEYKSQGVVDNK